MKILTVVGARPQFIKAAPVSSALRDAGIEEFLVHTGQHYDEKLSATFFDDLSINAPAVNLGVGSDTHGAQTGAMLSALEKLMMQEQPEWVLVYGDTNSTLAGALAAAKLQVKLVHVEAGLRSFNKRMPEEINRIVADHLSDLLLCPSMTAIRNLEAEGITKGIALVGDVMVDALHQAVERAKERPSVLKGLGLRPRQFVLATIHRAENTDDPSRLRQIVSAFLESQEEIIMPVHPRTRKALNALGVLPSLGKLRTLEPVGYLDMIMLESSARVVLTDSGGVQKEAYWLGVPCLTLRDETEWVETVEAGWNRLVKAETPAILAALKTVHIPSSRPVLYGDGHAAVRSVDQLLAYGRTIVSERKAKLSQQA